MINKPKVGDTVWSIAPTLTESLYDLESDPREPYHATVTELTTWEYERTVMSAGVVNHHKRTTPILKLFNAENKQASETPYSEVFETEKEAWKGYAERLETDASNLKRAADTLMTEHTEIMEEYRVTKEEAQKALKKYEAFP